MSFLAAAALSAGASALGSKRQGDKAADVAAGNMSGANESIQKGISYLDGLQPAIDNFAQMGQDNYDKYQRMMGPMEDNLNNYYMGLNPDELAAQGNQTAQQQFQGANKQYEDQLAAQGIDPRGGIGTQIGMQNANQMAQTKSQNIMNAPHQVAQQQQGWMNYTAGQGNQAFNQAQSGLNAQTNQANQYNQAYSNMANLYGGASNMANQNAQNSYQQQNNALGTMGEAFAWM